MYVSNLLHFLDEKGSIPKDFPVEAKQFAGALLQFVLFATNFDGVDDEMPQCFVLIDDEHRCGGRVAPMILLDDDHIYWHCDACGNEGVITHWQNTFWDLSENENPQ